MPSPPPSTGARVEQGRPVPLRTSVTDVSSPAPRLRRLTLSGGDLDHFVWSGPAGHFKLILPAPGHGPDVLPPAGVLQPVRLDRSVLTVRTYTPRAWDAAGGVLTVDVVVHGAGPASDWAAAARPGAALAVTSPLGRYDVDPQAAWLLLAGDESALPAIATILEVVPPTLPTTVLAETAGADGRFDLGAGPAVDIRWLDQDGAPPGGRLAEAVRSSLPAGDGRVWVGCESHAMLAIRRHLLDQRGLARRSVATRGYWTATERTVDERAEPTSRWLRD